MHRQMVLGQWVALRGPIRQRWDRIDDATLDRVAGNFDAFLDAIQGAYGIGREQAESEVTEFMLRFPPEDIRPKE